jgi:putative hydrolase
MSEPGRPGGSNPFEGIPFLADLSRLPPAEGPVHWAVALQMAHLVATEGEAEEPVEEAERGRLDELVRVADLHVAEATGLATTVTGRAPRALPLTRAEWARRGLVAHRPLLEALAGALARSVPEHDAEPDASGEPAPDRRPVPAPVMHGLVFGWMFGRLARQWLGRYDLPLPAPPTDEVVLVPANLEDFARGWALQGDELALWVCLHELAHHAVLGRPPVRGRLQSLLLAYAAGFDVDPTAFDAELEEIDASDPTSFRAVLGDPETMLAAVQTPVQRELLARLEAVTAVLEGFVDHVMDTVGGRLIASYPQLTEALRRRRVEASWGDRYVAKLLGLELRQHVYDRGQAFVRGVLERAGEEGLARLWASEPELPTPSEVDAPGLWLARIELPDQP